MQVQGQQIEWLNGASGVKYNDDSHNDDNDDAVDNDVAEDTDSQRANPTAVTGSSSDNAYVSPSWLSFGFGFAFCCCCLLCVLRTS